MVYVAGPKFDAWNKRNAWWTCLIVAPTLIFAALFWIGLVLSQVIWERLRPHPAHTLG